MEVQQQQQDNNRIQLLQDDEVHRPNDESKDEQLLHDDVMIANHPVRISKNVIIGSWPENYAAKHFVPGVLFLNMDVRMKKVKDGNRMILIGSKLLLRSIYQKFVCVCVIRVLV